MTCAMCGKPGVLERGICLACDLIKAREAVERGYSISGEDGCYQAWLQPDRWTSRRVGTTFASRESAVEAAEREMGKNNV